MKTLLSATLAAEQLGVAKQTLAIWRVRGVGPQFVKVGARVLYAQDDLDAWIDSRKRASTSDRGLSASATSN
jgi:hypothetical protein